MFMSPLHGEREAGKGSCRRQRVVALRLQPYSDAVGERLQQAGGLRVQQRDDIVRPYSLRTIFVKSMDFLRLFKRKMLS